MNITKKLIGALVALFAALTLTSVGAFAAGPRPGGGEPPTEELSNNLSIPAVFVGSVGFGLPATSVDGPPTALVPPTGEPSTNWPIDTSAYYYVQGVNTWQAQYVLKTSDTVTAEWGDNLSGDAKLKVGSPVRVEMVLLSETSLQGYQVVKLEPAALDRLAAYGTLATSDGLGGYTATEQTMQARVWGPNASVDITGPGIETVPLSANMPGEINATGGVVFGYNWWPTEPGVYTLTFNPPVGVTISDAETAASIEVTVGVGGGGGGGSKGKGRVR